MPPASIAGPRSIMSPFPPTVTRPPCLCSSPARLLSTVISDITGVTGLRIVRDIIAGQTDPRALAQHRDARCQASEADIRAALTGHYRPEHVFVLQQNLELFDAYQRQLAACDAAIE